MASILLLNGPNLNLLGTREPEVYGSDTLEQIVAECRSIAAVHGFDVTDVQSNVEGELVDALHAARDTAVGVVIHAGANTPPRSPRSSAPSSRPTCRTSLPATSSATRR